MGGVYAFGECEFHVDQRLLLRVGKPLPLGGRALDLLMLLVAQRHRTVGKQELIDHCWPDQAVEPNNLAVQVWMLLLFLLGVFGPQAGVVAGVLGTLMLCFYFGMLMRFGRGHARLMADAIRMRHEQSALVRQLQQRSAEAEQARQATTDFFAAASHDLRQPVQALSFYAGLLGTPDEPPQLRQRLDGCVQVLSHLFDGILGVAQLDAGKVVARPGPVRLLAVAERLMPLYADAAQRRGLRLRWRIPAHAVVWTDALLLERILGNLLAKALRFTPEGGVLVAARRRKWQGQCGWSLVVVDTGIVIALADQRRIWQAFVQVHTPQRDADRGVGLGLPTVKRLADLLGHAIGMRSHIGRGSCFELRLPAAQPGSETPAPAAADGDPDQDKLRGRALVADDHAAARSALAMSLRHWGLVCDGAADAEQALVSARRHAHDVLLCDLALPGGVDGVALLAQLQKLQPHARLSTIVSASAPPSALAAGAPVWLSKPLRPVRLRALL